MRISNARVRSAIGVATALAFVAGRVLAAPPTDDDRRAAAALFDEGTKAFAAGAFRVAAGEFESAYARAPHHAPLFNAARAWHRAGELPRAATLYAKYIATAPADAHDRPAASAGLREIAPRLVRLEIDAPGFDVVRVDDQPVDSRVVYVLPGTHAIAATGRDALGRTQTAHDARAAAAGGALTVSLAPDAAPASVGAGDASSAASPSTAAASRRPASNTADALAPRASVDPRDEPRHGWSPVVVWVGAGLTVASVALGILSEADYARYKHDHPGATGDTLQQETTRLHRSSFLLGSAVVLGVASAAAAIWLVDWRSRDTTARVGASADGVVLVGTF